jgi:hypothetical protein
MLRAAAAAVVACLLPLAACTDGSGGGPSPSPTPTYQPSRPETSLERQTRLDFEAAEKSYRAFIAEYNRLARAGGAKNATPKMKEYAAGPFLDFYVDLLRSMKERQVRNTSGVQIGYVRRGGYGTTELTLEVCEDGSENKVVGKNGEQISTGQIGLRSIYAKKVDGRWKAWDGDERGPAQSCQS